MQNNIRKFSACFLYMIASLLWLSLPAEARQRPPEPKLSRPVLADSAGMTAAVATTQPVGHYEFCGRYPNQCRARKDTAPLKLTEEKLRLLIRVNSEINNRVEAASDQEIYGREEYWEYPDEADEQAQRGETRRNSKADEQAQRGETRRNSKADERGLAPARLGASRKAADEREAYASSDIKRKKAADERGGKLRGDCEDYALMKQRELEKQGIAAANLLITVVRKANGEAHAVLTARTDKGDYILDNLRNSVLDWRRTNYLYIKRQSAGNAGQWVEIRTSPNAPAALLAANEQSKQAKSGAQQAEAESALAKNSRALASTKSTARPAE